MKKFMFIALPALVLASCSSDDVMNESSKGISFLPGINKGSRAIETTTANIKEFNVTAIGNEALYFSDVNIKKNGAAWDSEYLWPNYDLDFFAYSPSVFGGTADITADAQKLTDVKIEQKLADQKDIVVARNSGTKQGEKVGLTFEHALSAVKISAKVVNPNLKYEIIGVKICDIQSKGTFTYPALKDGDNRVLADFDNNSWDVTANELASYIAIDSKKPIVLTQSATAKSLMPSDKEFFMPLPQQLEAWNTINNPELTEGAYVSLLCRIHQSDNKGGYVQIFPTLTEESEGKYSFAALPIALNMQPGKRYHIVLNLDGGGFLDPDPTDPDKPEPDPDDPIIPEPDPDDPDDPDPILPGKISYDVIVTPWVDAEGGDVVLDYSPAKPEASK